MNETTIHQILEKHPQLQSHRSKLEAMSPGAYCLHPSWGFGRIQSYNADENRLIIDFENDRTGHKMDPAFCVDKLEVLSDDSLIVLRYTQPKTIDNLMKTNPAQLVVQALTSFPDKTASTLEIEKLLSRTVGETRFKKWWISAKKTLAQDPRIACPARKTEPYILRDEPLKPEIEVLENFFAIRNPREKIVLAEKLLALSTSVEEIAHDLPRILDTLTEVVQNAHQLSEAERLQGVWVRNDLARLLKEDLDNFEPTSTSILLNSRERLSDIVEALPSVQYKRFFSLLTRAYPDNWTDTALDLLRISSGKFTNECIVFLVDHEKGETLKEAFVKWLNEQSLKGPVIAWIFKNRKSKKFANYLRDLMSPRLLGAALYAIDYEALQLNTVRRIPLAEQLSDDADLVSDLLEDASAETASDLAHALISSQGFEELTKKSLLARFIKKFPSIQSLLTGSETQNQSERLIVSRSSFDARKREYEILVSEKIPENKQAIATAREHGDLRENSEYKMARQDQEMLMARKAILESELSRASVTDFKDAHTDCVSIGSIVGLIEVSTGNLHSFTILGAWDSDPANNILSYKTPLGKSLLSKKVGETVETTINNHQEKWNIHSIARYVDKNAE